jgi:hypothetical protein
MGRLRFVVGALGIIVGVFVYQYGLFLTLDHSEASLLGVGLPSLSEVLLPLFGSASAAGAILQLVGSIIAIAGFLVCISYLGTQRPKLTSVVSAKPVASSLTQMFDTRPKCKFCGAVMESGTAFCPNCQRSQA